MKNRQKHRKDENEQHGWYNGKGRRVHTPPSLGFWPKSGSATAGPGASSSSGVVLVRPLVVRGFRCVDRRPGILPRRRLRAPNRRIPFTPLGNGLPLGWQKLRWLLLIRRNPLHGVMKLLMDHEIIKMNNVEGPSVPASIIKQKRCR